MKIIIGLIIPFIGTSLGAGLVYFFKNNISNKSQAILLAFSSGIMIAASIWSLLLPSLEIGLIPTLIGFVLGVIFLGLINSDNSTSNMMFAVTLHNIPEGMAVGVSYLYLISGNSTLSYISCLMLSIGIAIQNFPEGAAVSLPLRREGYSLFKAFFIGQLSAIVEPISAVIGVLLVINIKSLLPLMLSMASGAMFYVCFQELIPESQKNSRNLATLFTILGFIIMMILDVALG